MTEHRRITIYSIIVDNCTIIIILFVLYQTYMNKTLKRDKVLKREEKEKATRASQDCAIFSGLAVEMPQALIRLPPLLPSHFLLFSLQWIDSGCT